MKYEEWLKKENLIRIKGWAREGLTDEQIAKKIGISRSTLNVWRGKFSDLADTLKIGKETADYLVEESLFKDALTPGNTVAKIYWLNNRRPDKWSNKQTANNDDVIKKLDQVIGDINVIAHE